MRNSVWRPAPTMMEMPEEGHRHTAHIFSTPYGLHCWISGLWQNLHTLGWISFLLLVILLKSRIPKSNYLCQASTVHEPWTSRCSSWTLKRQRNQRWNCQHLLDRKSTRVPENYLFLLYWLCQGIWLCGSQQTVENSSRDGNTKPPYLHPEKSICRSKSNS